MPNAQNDMKLPTQLPYKQVLIEPGINLGILDDVKFGKR
jgi:hypothetical protein